jgi:hypothetical protein
LLDFGGVLMIFGNLLIYIVNVLLFRFVKLIRFMGFGEVSGEDVDGLMEFLKLVLFAGEVGFIFILS